MVIAFLCNSRCNSRRRNGQCQFGTVWVDDTLVAIFFRGTSESSISFCLLVWNCRQNGVKILTWLGWFFFYLAFRYMHFCFGITSRERDWWMHAVNIGFYPLGKTTSVHYSLYYSLSFFRRHASGAAAALVCEWMDTCLKVNHDFKKMSVYKCLGCCNLKCLKMTLLVSKDRIGEGGY